MATQGAMPATTSPAPASDAPFIRDFSAVLRAHRAERARCAEVLRTISEACRADHGKAHTFECAPCHQAAVDEIRRRYLGPESKGSSGEEWFSGRESFLGELAQMLDGARERRVALRDVDARIEGEKRRWYRDVLRTYPFFVTPAIESVGLEEFRAVLGADKSEDEVADVVRKGIAPVRGGPIDPETFLAASDPSNPGPKKNDELAHLLFETDAGKIPDGAEQYADLLRTGTPLEHLMSTIARDTTPWNPTAPDLEVTFRRGRDERAARRAEAREARRRLDELERAGAAHKKIQTARTEERDRRLRGEFFELPACAGCGGGVGEGGGRVVACTLCQVLVDMGLKGAQTVYCSVKCHGNTHVSLFEPLAFPLLHCHHYQLPSAGKGRKPRREEVTNTLKGSHVRDTHTCTAGPKCLQNTPSPPPASTSLCRECALHSKATPYCSPPCAASALAPHLEEAHPALWTEARGPGGNGPPGENGAAGRDGVAGEGGVAGKDGALRDVGRFVVGLEEVHSEKIGKKVRGAELVA